MIYIFEDNVPSNPRNGTYVEHKNSKFVTLYNSIIDTYGIYKVNKDYSNIFWTPPYKYIYPVIDWEKIWKEMDYCFNGYIRPYVYSVTINGPEIHFANSKL